MRCAGTGVPGGAQCGSPRRGGKGGRGFRRESGGGAIGSWGRGTSGQPAPVPPRSPLSGANIMMVAAGRQDWRFVQGVGDPGDPTLSPEPRRIVVHPHIHSSLSSEAPRRGRPGVGRTDVNHLRSRTKIPMASPTSDNAVHGAGKRQCRPCKLVSGGNTSTTHAREGPAVCAGACVFRVHIVGASYPGVTQGCRGCGWGACFASGSVWLGRGIGSGPRSTRNRCSCLCRVLKVLGRIYK